MEGLKEFLLQFFRNKGQHVFLSLLIAKISAFLGSLFIIRILPESEFGTISIVASVFAVFVPFSGFGSQQSLLRFGSLGDDLTTKKALSRYLFIKGFGFQVLLSVLFLVISFFYLNRYEDIFYIFMCFAVRLMGVYFFSHIQSDLRIFGKNAEFAKLNNFVNITGVMSLLVLSYFFGLKGYLIAIASTPFLALFWLKRRHLTTITGNFSFSKKEIWNYGFHAAGTALLSDALFSADVLMLSFLMNETAVANYKVAILIPANITFLALTFMQSDFPVLAKNHQNKNFLINYISNYYKIFIPVIIVILGLGFLLKSEILDFFFGSKYADNSSVFIILLAGFCMNMLLRNLYGNLLSAVGKMSVNTWISVFTLILLPLSSIFFVEQYGVTGMALSLSLTMLLNGLLLMIYFQTYLKKLK
ncbi:MAG: oligosaccharide flippase family protein [Kaistella sp.]